jgi:hypothetical protein
MNNRQANYKSLGILDVWSDLNLDRLGRVVDKYADIPWEEALSKGQVQSKIWLLNELLKVRVNLGIVYVIGGWIGLLAYFMAQKGVFNYQCIFNIDKDAKSSLVASELNCGVEADDIVKFRGIVVDAMSLTYQNDFLFSQESNQDTFVENQTPDVIINTSCEHFPEFASWRNKIPKGKLLILQSNNLRSISDHVNCVRSIEEFKSQAKFSEILYSGVLNLSKYDRFMLIGHT